LAGHKIIIPIIGSLTALTIVFFEFKSRLTVFLGKISFSLYLIHFTIGSKVINLGRHFVNKEWEKCLLLIITLFVTIIFAYIFHKLIVIPAQKLSKKVKYQFLTTP
jgi:peptidoglycan/LPS O-acetylase OafA/YrhL